MSTILSSHLSWHFALHYSRVYTMSHRLLTEVSGMVLCHVLLRLRGTKLLATSTSAVEWYKSRAYTSFLSKIIQNSYMCQANVKEV